MVSWSSPRGLQVARVVVVVVVLYHCLGIYAGMMVFLRVQTRFWLFYEVV